MGICLIIKSGGGIDTSSATATADKILSGYTIYSNDNKITGNMTNVGTQTVSNLNAGGSTTIKTGWHNGNGAVTTNSLSSQTSADIPDTSWCLSGYTYWKNGSKSTGTMVNRGTKTWSIGANGSQTIESGWHNGNGIVKQSINVDTGEWGPNPTTTNQQLCWQGWYYSKNRWCWGNGNLTAGNIKKDITIFGVKGTYYETKRYLIQNGAFTGLCNCSYAGSGPQKTVSWGGSTWRLLTGKAYTATGNEDDDWVDWDVWSIITGWKKYVSASYTVGSANNMKIGCVVGGDFLVDTFNGRKSGQNITAGITTFVATGVNPRYSTRRYDALSAAGASITCTCGTYKTYSANGAIEITKYTTHYDTLFADGNMIIVLHGYGHSPYKGYQCGTNIYAKNLWLDTSQSMNT